MFMRNWLNDKLYNQYYPLETEEEKNKFLESNYFELCNIMNYMGRGAIAELHAVRFDYIKRMKPTVSFFGKPKYSNIAYNKYLVHMMCMDKRANRIVREFQDISLLEYKIMNNDLENITVDELNCLLRLKNAKRSTNCMVLLALISIIVCIYIFAF